MKNILADCVGNYWWGNTQEYIWNKDKNGKFFYGIYTENFNLKEIQGRGIGFRICRKETK